MKRFVEACCPSAEAARLACASGAGRIELCERLEVGGVTPCEELLREVLGFASIPVNVLVRQRDGDFVYSEDEIREMLSSIELCRKLGASGVVIGALDRNGAVDMAAMKRLVDAARGEGTERRLSVTFHRAFDVCSDPIKAFEDILSLGCDRLLTSGHEDNAVEGRFMIGELVRISAGRTVVMAGCGVRPENIALIERDSSAPEYHSSFISADY